MPSETTYWIIVIAALAAALALYLLTRDEKPAPKAKAKREAPKAPARVAKPVAAPEPVPVVDAEPVTEAVPVVEPMQAAPRRAGRPKGSGKAKAKAAAPDNLVALKGLGPKAAARLNALGITRFDQIAAWSDEDVARIAPELGNFRDRVVRDRWVEQAGHLASGDTAGFEAKFGKLG